MKHIFSFFAIIGTRLRHNRNSIGVITVLSGSIILLAAYKLEGECPTLVQETIACLTLVFVCVLILIGGPATVPVSTLAPPDRQKQNEKIESQTEITEPTIIHLAPPPQLSDDQIIAMQLKKYKSTFWINHATNATAHVSDGPDHEIQTERLRSNGYVVDNSR